jgi:GPH family glycoside/pentoside/hexuronide:cation symporter
VDSLLSFGKKLSYGVGRFGSSLLLALIELTSFWIYSAVFQLNWFINGLVQAVAFLVIGFTHWLIGYYSDGVQSRYGRRKPFVIIGAPGLAITTIFLFIPHFFLPIGSSNLLALWLLFTYYLVFLCLFKFFYAFMLTAFQAWLPEIADEGERPLISSMQNTANWFGSVIGSVLGFLFAVEGLFFMEIAPTVNIPTMLLIVMVATFSLLEILFYLPSIAFIREKPGLVIPERSIRNETMTVLRNRTYVGWFLMVGFLSTSLSAIKGNMLGFIEHVVMLSAFEDILVVALALIVTLMVFLYVWAFLMKRIGKQRTMIISLLILVFTLPLTVWVGGAPLYPVVKGVLYFIPIATSMAGYYIMSYVVPADITHVDSLVTGNARAGIYEGFKGVPLNIFQAFSMLLLGYIMDLSVIQTGTETLGYLWFGPIFTIFVIIAIVILLFINLDHDFEALGQRPTGDLG